jgi:hypothetical protein
MAKQKKKAEEAPEFTKSFEQAIAQDFLELEARVLAVETVIKDNAGVLVNIGKAKPITNYQQA